MPARRANAPTTCTRIVMVTSIARLIKAGSHAQRTAGNPRKVSRPGSNKGRHRAGKPGKPRRSQSAPGARTDPGTLTAATRPGNAVINGAKATTSRGVAPAVVDVLIAVGAPVAVAGADVVDDFPPACYFQTGIFRTDCILAPTLRNAV